MFCTEIAMMGPCFWKFSVMHADNGRGYGVAMMGCTRDAIPWTEGMGSPGVFGWWSSWVAGDSKGKL